MAVFKLEVPVQDEWEIPRPSDRADLARGGERECVWP